MSEPADSSVLLVGRDESSRTADGGVIEYWDGGDEDGRPVIFHPGTPATRFLGRWAHEAAVAAGVRLIAVNRPGYGGTTPARGVPSLSATGRQTAEFARSLGLHHYAVVGVSGGGPFALSTAAADPTGVRALGLVAGVGPWRTLDEPTDADQEDRSILALLDDGDVAGARFAMRRAAERDLQMPDPEARVDAVLEDSASPLARDPQYRALWMANMSVVLDRPDGLEGYVFDTLAWGGSWDVRPGDVTAPTLIWDGGLDGARHGRWYAENMPGSTLVVWPDEGHLDVCDGHWPAVMSALTTAWR